MLLWLPFGTSVLVACALGVAALVIACLIRLVRMAQEDEEE